MKHYYTLALLLFLGLFSAGQQDKLKKSNEAFSNYSFANAQQLYLDLVADGYESAEIYEKLGDSYYFNNDYVNAHKWYSKLFGYGDAFMDREHKFRYIQTLKTVGDTATASRLYSKFAFKDNKAVVMKQIDAAAMIDFQSGRYDMRSLSLNTDQQEFGTSFYSEGNKVIFAKSSKPSSLIKRNHKWSGRPFLDLYTGVVNTSSGEITEVEELKVPKINSRLHESNAVFTKDETYVYFTSNSYTDDVGSSKRDKTKKLKLYRAHKVDGNWEDIEELPFNDDSWSTAHPALSPDDKTLYFSSDRPGSTKALDGTNSSDIWYVNINADGSFTQPQNLSVVNTPAREMFPYMSKTENLYFSSTGYNGLGGLDVFVVSLAKDNASFDAQVINVGRPINSGFDDFGFVINDVNKLGYVSSNRKGGNGLDDIYTFRELEPLRCEVNLNVVVTDKQTGALLPGALVMLLDATNKEIDKVVVGNDASYSFTVGCDQQYSIRAKKEGYEFNEESTITPKQQATIELPLALNKSMDTKITGITEGVDLAKVFDIVIYFDLNKSNIRPDAQVQLEKLYRYMQANPNLRVAITSHTDSRAADGYNLKLSDRRAKASKAYLESKGIAPSRLTARGYGEYQLINDCSNGVKCTDEEHQQNRRSEFIVISQ